MSKPDTDKAVPAVVPAAKQENSSPPSFDSGNLPSPYKTEINTDDISEDFKYGMWKKKCYSQYLCLLIFRIIYSLEFVIRKSKMK